MSETAVHIEDNINSVNQADTYAVRLLKDWPGGRLLAANLEALAERDKLLADVIAAAVMPEGVEMAAARDGSATFRRRGEDGRYSWLGYSTVPLIAAASNLKRTELSGANMAMNGIGTGAEAAGILSKMAGHQALLVVERDALALKLVFQLRDFTDYLVSGRLILLLGDDPVELLERFYEDNPGYALVDQASTWHWLSDRENQGFAQKVSQAMGRASKNTWAKMKHLLDEQKAYDQRTTLAETVRCLSQPGLCRAANCTDANTPNDYCAGRDVLAGLEQLGTAADWLVFDRPEFGSQYAQLARLNRVRPHLILLVDKLRKDIALSLPESAVCATLLRAPGPALLQPPMPPGRRMGPNDFVFAARRQQLEQLEQAGFPPERLVCLPLGANTDLFRPVDLDDAERKRYGAEVVLISTKHSVDPETYQIKLPTHHQLFHAVIEEIKKAPDKYYHDGAPRFLSRAQRCGIEIKDDDLRRFFTELIQNYLGNTVLCDIYGEALGRGGFKLSCWSWSATPVMSAWGKAPPYMSDVTAGKQPVSAGAEPTTAWAEPKAAGVEPTTAWAEPILRDRAETAEIKKDKNRPGQADKVIDYGLELNKLYNAGKIFLHISGSGFADDYLLNGVAAGAFFLVKAHPRDNQADGVGEMFELGRELITFDTPDDLVGKVRYFLSHDRQREEIARAARQKLLARHAYKIRARQILDAIIEGIQ